MTALKGPDAVGNRAFEYDYYCRLLEIWRHIDGQSWQGFNIFMVFEGAVIAAFAAVFAMNMNEQARASVLWVMALLALSATVMWWFAFNRRKEALRMIGHQARVLERSIFSVQIAAGKEQDFFPMFFHGNRAIFTDMRKEGERHFWWRTTTKRKLKDFEARIRKFHTGDVQEIIVHDDPEELDWRAGFSEAEIINNQVPGLFILFWTILLAGVTYFLTVYLENAFGNVGKIDWRGIVSAIAVILGVPLLICFLRRMAKKRLGYL